MLLINRGETNQCPFTFYEKTTIVNPYYLIEFENQQTKVKSYCIVHTNLSDELQRFDEFEITETSNPDPTAAQVELTVGDYIYTAYEQASSTNLDPTGLDIVEEMQCQVKDASIYPATAYSGASTENTAYEG